MSQIYQTMKAGKENVMELYREKGIQAIVDLQKFAGIDEPRERAEKNWDKLNTLDKKKTMIAHKIFCSKQNQIKQT